MPMKQCVELIEAFKERFRKLNPDVPEDEVVNRINNGYCYALAVVLKMRMSKYINRSEIVRSRGHWFFRFLSDREWTYYDAWMCNGTTEFLDITEAIERDLEVWTIDDVLKELNANRVLEYISVLDEVK